MYYQQFIGVKTLRYDWDVHSDKHVAHHAEAWDIREYVLTVAFHFDFSWQISFFEAVVNFFLELSPE